jgi:hypothetical protein
LSWAQKPSSQLGLGVAGYSTAQGGTGVTVVPVRPQSYVHQLVAADFVQRGVTSDLKWSLGISALRERPQSPNYGSGWTFNEYSEALLWSPYLEFSTMDWKFSLASIEVQGGQALPQGPAVKNFSSFLPDRYPFDRALRLGIQWERIWNRNEGLMIQSRILVHPSGGFSLWDQSLSYQFQSRWMATLSALLVEAGNNHQKTLFGRFQNLDLVALGISYAF